MDKEELKELPKSWAIRGCKELREFIQQCEETKRVRIRVYGDFTNYYYYLKDNNNTLSWTSVRENYFINYTEISFEDFKRLVLKEPKFKVGDRVEPIKMPMLDTIKCKYIYLSTFQDHDDKFRKIGSIDISNNTFQLEGDVGSKTVFNIKDFKLTETKEETMITKEEFNNKTQIKIPEDLLFTYYKASQPHQKEYLNKHFQLDGSTTIEAIKGLYDIACEGWKPKIKSNHPEVFKEDKVWKRKMLNDKGKHFYFITDCVEGDFFTNDSSNSDVNLNFTFSTEQEADNNALLYNTMMLMRSWAKFYNEVDGFKVDWSILNQSKAGIELNNNEMGIYVRANTNAFLFQISLSTQKRAEEMLAEFKDDLEKLIALGMFN